MLPEIMCAMVELAESMGVSSIGELPEPWRGDLVDGFGFAFNGANEERGGIPAFTCAFTLRGVPVAMVNPGGGAVVQALDVNEDTLIEAIRRTTSGLGVSL